MNEIINEDWLLEHLPEGWTYNCVFEPEPAFMIYAGDTTGAPHPRFGPFVLPLRLLHNPSPIWPRQVTVDRSVLLNLMDLLRLAHVYALKDSHPEELGDDFKSAEWDDHEVAYAHQATNAYRELMDAIIAFDESQSGIPERMHPEDPATLRDPC